MVGVLLNFGIKMSVKMFPRIHPQSDVRYQQSALLVKCLLLSVRDNFIDYVPTYLQFDFC